MRPISVRPMTLDDIPGLAEWMVKYPLWAGYGLTAERARGVMERGLAEQEILLVADSEDVPACGFAYCLPRGAFAFSPYLRWLAVRQDMTGAGVGGVLLDAVEAAARPIRPELFLLAAHFNTSAHRFYERHGYSKIGEVPDYVVTGATELIYWKHLREQDGVS